MTQILVRLQEKSAPESNRKVVVGLVIVLPNEPDDPPSTEQEKEVANIMMDAASAKLGEFSKKWEGSFTEMRRDKYMP